MKCTLLCAAFVFGLMGCAAASSEDGSSDEGASESAIVNGSAGSVLFLGMNSVSRASEMAALERQGVRVLSAAGGPQNGFARIDGVDREVSSKAGHRALVDALDLDQARSERLLDFLSRFTLEASDEIAQLVQAFDEIEKGAAPPVQRIVFSGHSAGLSISGERDEDGTVFFEVLEMLKDVFPRAVGAIEHLAISGCNTALNVESLPERWLFEDYRAIFPNLRSIWAYKGKSPTIPASSEHLKAWESSTRNGFDPAALEKGRIRASAFGGRNAKHVRIWTDAKILGE